MQIIKKFDKDGISLEMLMKSIVTQTIDEVIDDALFNQKYEGDLGDNEYEHENKTSEL